MRHLASALCLPLAIGCAEPRSEADASLQRLVEQGIADLFHPAPEVTPAQWPDLQAGVDGAYVCTSTVGGQPVEWAVEVMAETEEYSIVPRFETYASYLEVALTNQLARHMAVDLTQIDCPADVDPAVPGATHLCSARAGEVPFQAEVTVQELVPPDVHPNYTLDARGAQFRLQLDSKVGALVSGHLGIGVEARCFMPNVVTVEVGAEVPCGLSIPSRGPDRVGTGTLTTTDADGTFSFNYSLD